MRQIVLVLWFSFISFSVFATKTYTYDLRKVGLEYVMEEAHRKPMNIALKNYRMYEVGMILRYWDSPHALILKQGKKSALMIQPYHFEKAKTALPQVLDILKKAQKHRKLLSVRLEGYAMDELASILEYGRSIYALRIEAKQSPVQLVDKAKDLSFLKILDLSYTNTTDQDVHMLVASEKLQTLEVLNFSHNYVTQDGAKSIASSASLRNLKALDLNASEDFILKNKIGEEGIITIAQSSHLIHLESLDVANNNIGDQGVKAIAGSQNFKNLRDLNIASNGVTDEGFMAIISSRSLKQLENLWIHGNAITDKSVTALAEQGHFPKLEFINLMNTKRLNYSVALALSKSKAFPMLKKACLSFAKENMHKIRQLGKKFNKRFHYCAGP